MSFLLHTHSHGHGDVDILSFLETLLHTLTDTAVILPFMFLAFLCIGLLERGAGRKMVAMILAADKIGPLAGGLLGALPSCGFSAASSNLFGAGLLTTGTLLSVYLSTSDEMIAVMVANRADILLILKILLIKVGCAIFCGFLVDGGVRLFYYLREKKARQAISEDDTDTDEAIDEAMDCGCSDAFCAAKGNLFVSAIVRTLRIYAFIFVISLVINVLLIFVDQAAIGEFLQRMPVLGCIISGLLGLIPNCAVSVALTEFYLDGIITAPMLLSGLMTGAGSGILVLLRTNENKLENITVIGLLTVFGIGLGSLCGVLFF